MAYRLGERVTMEADMVPFTGVPVMLRVHTTLPRPTGQVRWRRREGSFLVPFVPGLQAPVQHLERYLGTGPWAQASAGQLGTTS